MFERFSQRTRRVIFWSLHYSRLAGSPYIEPEHILEGLLCEDPQLFHLILPGNPDLVRDLQAQLAAKRATPIKDKRDVPLSPPGKAVVVGAADTQLRFGHRQVTNQHLMLALLTVPAPSSSWFGKRKGWPVQRLLADHGFTPALVEEKTRHEAITTSSRVLDDGVVALNAQIGALGELFITKGLFSREEYVALLDQYDGPLPPQAFLQPLIDAFASKGLLTDAEKQTNELIVKDPSKEKSGTQADDGS